jgi:hypothetical protein
MNKYTMYLAFIIMVKVAFLILAVLHIYLKVKGKENSETDKKIEYWKERLEFIFVLLMAMLLIYLFNPHKSVVLTSETKLLLHLFGFFLVITANWGDFIRESLLFKRIQAMVGKP